jgi:S1-C subfamily serine protease
MEAAAIIFCSFKTIISSLAGKDMNDPTPSRLGFWRQLAQHFRSTVKRTAPFAAGVLAALLALLLYNALFPTAKPLTAREVKNSVIQVLASATPAPTFSSRVYQVIQPSLVLIETKASHENSKDDFGLGSGVIIDDQGNILTSLHVVEGSTEIRVTFADGSQSRAIIVGELPEKDIAVLQAETLPELLIPAVLGNPGAMSVGDEAFVVGNPFGLYSSMSTGVISGLNRQFKLPNKDIEMQGMIQIDAAVNPGNSGGPLLNRNGDVIGIVTGIVNPTDQNFFVGIGFAVPINVALGGIGGSPPY